MMLEEKGKSVVSSDGSKLGLNISNMAPLLFFFIKVSLYVSLCLSLGEAENFYVLNPS